MLSTGQRDVPHQADGSFRFHCESFSFRQFLVNAGVPASGYDPETFPNCRWHRVTICVLLNLNFGTQKREYVKLGYVWLPHTWDTPRLREALRSRYTHPFLLEDDSFEAQTVMSKQLATDLLDSHRMLEYSCR